MQIVIETSEFKPCICGHIPTKYLIGYGRTPYSLYCTCGKSLFDSKCKITGHHNNLIDYWNNYIRKISKEQLLQDANNFRQELKKVIIDNEQTPKMYKYFWVKNEGETLVQSW